MGAVSGDVNTPSTRCANATDLSSRPIAGLQDGDRAYLLDREGTNEGPIFFLSRSSVRLADNVGVILPLGGVGRWLSEALYGSTGATRSTSADIEPGDPPVVIPAALGVVLETPALIAPADGVIDVDASMSVDGGTTGTEVWGRLRARINGGAAQILDGSTFGQPTTNNIATGDSQSIGLTSQLEVAEGDSVVLEIAAQNDGADVDGRVQGAFLRGRFFSS